MASSAYKRLARTDHTYHHNVETQKPQRGFVFMYIGKERKRYEIPVTYLNYPMLKDLMKKLLQDGELECRIDGPIVLLCTAEVFDQVLEECAAYTIK
ncbi:conserved hypothetical protein [Ricinus communis]|uniref:Small auxin-up RNA n=1 Tax=Ricinus communis TaxID=3988 RepID=B9SS52_RICCO|nr:conserved hypothetical protein [Ricinus communis]